MYSTCLFCHAGLGQNEVVETFPVGSRLAFDQARGRLWVVCRKCERWNLTPFDERWDAIEYCEKRFRDARKRVATDNIGLARLDEGLELVRIGEPLRPEFAAWRYGDQFGRRRRKNLIVTGGIGAVGVGLVAAADITGVLSGASWGIWQGYHALVERYRSRKVVARIQLSDATRIVVRGRDLKRLKLDLPYPEDGQIRLVLPAQGTDHVLTGHHARRAAALVMPGVNREGGKEKVVRAAVSTLEEAGSADELIGRLTRITNERMFTKSEKHEPGLVRHLGHEQKLALEMAVNEENERHALEGELTLLELEWKDAEELAGIADTLGVPEKVERQLEDLKARTAANPPA